jgi:hypothetical protein
MTKPVLLELPPENSQQGSAKFVQILTGKSGFRFCRGVLMPLLVAGVR